MEERTMEKKQVNEKIRYSFEEAFDTILGCIVITGGILAGYKIGHTVGKREILTKLYMMSIVEPGLVPVLERGVEKLGLKK